MVTAAKEIAERFKRRGYRPLKEIDKSIRVRTNQHGLSSWKVEHGPAGERRCQIEYD